MLARRPLARRADASRSVGARTLGAGLAAVMLALSAACTGRAPSTTSEEAPAGTVAATPAVTGSPLPARPVTHPTTWLCRPGLADNPCEGDLDATVIRTLEDRSVEHFAPAADPPADCFYIYPTVSTASGISAPLEVTDAERRAARAQAARFSQSCRVFAPLYRQITLSGLGAIAGAGAEVLAAAQQAYADVLSAFNDYLNTENHGRPVVLLAHSQGSWHATRLIQDQIDGHPEVRRLLLSALLLGSNVTTAPGARAGGSFVNVPTCASAEESGCVVGWATYSGVPPDNGLFGRSTEDRTALCVSAAALLGRGRDLAAYLPTAQITGGTAVAGIETSFVTIPGRVQGECRSTQEFGWLDVSIDTSGLTGAPDLTQAQGPAGLHTVDVSISLGDLVDLVAAQSAAWQERGGPS